MAPIISPCKFCPLLLNTVSKQYHSCIVGFFAYPFLLYSDLGPLLFIIYHDLYRNFSCSHSKGDLLIRELVTLKCGGLYEIIVLTYKEIRNHKMSVSVCLQLLLYRLVASCLIKVKCNSLKPYGAVVLISFYYGNILLGVGHSHLGLKSLNKHSTVICTYGKGIVSLIPVIYGITVFYTIMGYYVILFIYAQGLPVLQDSLYHCHL